MTRERRWIVGLAIVATVSLALNLIVAGIIIAHRMDGPPPLLDLAGPAFPDQIIGELSPEGRTAMQDSWREGRRALRDDFKALREMKREIKMLLDAEVLDRPALEAALDRVSTLTSRIQAGAQKSFLEGVSKLSADDRRRLRPARADRPDRPPRDAPPPPGDMPPPVPPPQAP